MGRLMSFDDATGFGMRLALIGFSTLLFGCSVPSSPEQAALLDKGRQNVQAEMAEVVPFVTPELLDECRVRLEQPSLLGAQYKLAGTPSPNTRYSCNAQIRGFLEEKTTKKVAYGFPLRKVAGMFGTGNATYVGSCVIGLTDGEAKVLEAVWEVKSKSPQSRCGLL